MKRFALVCLCALTAGRVVLGGQAPAQEARIVVHVDRLGTRIRRTLFGANICWPMYTNNLDQETQGAADFLALAPLARQLGLAMLRYPGGLWSDAHRWKRGIGPAAKRQGGSPNGTGTGQIPLIGTDELLRFCEAAGMQAVITVNYGLCQTESPEAAWREAADWVEYCNAPADGSNRAGGTDWAAVRARNGHRKPYGVRYWEIGNEIYIGERPGRRWGHTDVATYARRCVGFARAMKAVDPTIKVGAVAHARAGFVSPNDTVVGSTKPWNRTVLEIAGPHVDFLIPHLYAGGPGGLAGRLATNGVLQGAYDAPAPGDYAVTALVGGDRFRGEWSHFQLEVDGKPVAEFDTSSKRPSPFRHVARLAAGRHTIGVRFTNDLWVKGEGDRNLHLARLAVRAPNGAETTLRLIAPQDRVSLCTAVVEVERQRLRELRQLIRKTLPGKAGRFELAVTEWNEGQEVGTLSTALHCAAKLAMMAEEGVESAHYWLLFNAVQYRRTELWFPAGGARLPRPPAFVFQIFTRHCQARVAAADVVSPALPPLERPRKGWPPLGQALRVLATATADGTALGLVVINRNVTHAMATRITWPGFAAAGAARLTTLTGPDPFDRNTGCTSLDGLRVRAVRSQVPVQADGLTHTFPPMSVTGLTITGRKLER